MDVREMKRIRRTGEGRRRKEEDEKVGHGEDGRGTRKDEHKEEQEDVKEEEED